MSGIQPRGGRFKGDFFLIALARSGQGNTGADVFVPLFGIASTTTEADAAVTMDFPFLIRRLRVVVTTNALTGDLVVGFRVNGATVVSRTISTTAVGESASAVISAPVQSGDTANWIVNATDGAANTANYAAYLVCQRVAE